MSPTILVVDDHELYRSTFCALLQMCWPDAQIVEAADASQALALFPLHRWDVIVLDYQLPTLSGGDLARHLRSRASARGVPLAPLVVMSSQPDVAAFTRAIGAAAFLPKPVDMAELRTTLVANLPALASPQRLVQSPASSVAGFGQSAAPPDTPLVLRMSQARQPDPRSPLPLTRISQLRATILDLFQQTISSFPAPHAPAAAVHPGGQGGRVGEYLVQLGYLTPRQLARALQAAASQPPRGHTRLGFTLVANDLVPPQVLAAVLLLQFRDRLEQDPTVAPRFVGERLLVHTSLAPAQLALALQEQLESAPHGPWTRLGDIIVRHSWLDPVSVSSVSPRALRSAS
jgi:CheY-like chemotaxis protein